MPDGDMESYPIEYPEPPDRPAEPDRHLRLRRRRGGGRERSDHPARDPRRGLRGHRRRDGADRALAHGAARLLGLEPSDRALVGAASLRASRATCFGVSSIVRTCSGRTWAISQFWQNLHSILQPGVARKSEAVPGRTWLSGFFSIGSRCSEHGRECTRV